MTVSTTNSTEVFSGGQSVLNFNFSALVGFPQYIQVSVTALTGGTTTALSYSTQYTVTISSTGVGGTVIVLPTYGTNYNYVVYRQTSITQNSSYTNYNSFPASTLMSNLDQLTMIDQEQSTTTNLALSYPVGTLTSMYSTTAPLPSIGCVMTTNSAGTQWIASAGIAGPVGPSGATGTISSVSSSTSDITIVSTSTTPIITAVNAGTGGSNTILRLNSSGQLPALNGSLLTSLTNIVSSITAYGTSVSSGSAISFSSLKIYYGQAVSEQNITGLGFSSSTSYTVVAISIGDSSAAYIASNSSTAFTLKTADASTNSTMWFAIGI